MVMSNGPFSPLMMHLDPPRFKGELGKVFDRLFLHKRRAEKKVKEGEAKYLEQFPPEERAAKKKEFDQLCLESKLVAIHKATHPSSGTIGGDDLAIFYAPIN